MIPLNVQDAVAAHSQSFVLQVPVEKCMAFAPPDALERLFQDVAELEAVKEGTRDHVTSRIDGYFGSLRVALTLRQVSFNQMLPRKTINVQRSDPDIRQPMLPSNAHQLLFQETRLRGGNQNGFILP